MSEFLFKNYFKKKMKITKKKLNKIAIAKSNLMVFEMLTRH